jgi:hypothetical protein
MQMTFPPLDQVHNLTIRLHVITPDECITQAHDCSHQARQHGVNKRQRDVLYAMSRTWDTLARQIALLAELHAEQLKPPPSA